MNQLSSFDKLTFEDATKVLFYNFNDKKELFTEFIWDLINAETPNSVVTRKWYEDYKAFIQENKKSK